MRPPASLQTRADEMVFNKTCRCKTVVMSDDGMPDCEEESDTEIYDFGTGEGRALYTTARQRRLDNEMSKTPELPDGASSTELPAATNAHVLPVAVNAPALQVAMNAHVLPPQYAKRQLSRQQTRVVTRCVCTTGFALYDLAKFRVFQQHDVPTFRVREGDFVLCAPRIKMLAFLLGRVGIVRYVGSEEGSYWAFVEFAAHDVGEQTDLDILIFKSQAVSRPLIMPTLNWVPLMVYTKYPECQPTTSTVCDGFKKEEMVSEFVYRNRDGTACGRRAITTQDYSK